MDNVKSLSRDTGAPKTDGINAVSIVTGTPRICTTTITQNRMMTHTGTDKGMIGEVGPLSLADSMLTNCNLIPIGF